jgi:hypothetical protein
MKYLGYMEWHCFKNGKEVVGSFGVGVWKHIKREWGAFSRFVRYEVRDGTKIRFLHDLWCGD